VVCVPAGMRAEQHRELARGVRAVQDRPERLDDLASDLGKLGPVELGQPIPCGALERWQGRGLWRAGGAGRRDALYFAFFFTFCPGFRPGLGRPGSSAMPAARREASTTGLSRGAQAISQKLPSGSAK
jgi:hypothetical protein